MRRTDHQTKMEHTETGDGQEMKGEKKKVQFFYIRCPNTEDGISCLDGKGML